MTDVLAKRSASVELARGLAQEIAGLEPTQYGAYWEVVLGLESSFTQLREMMQDRALARVRTEGTRTTEKGTMDLATDEHLLRAIPTRTGVDPKVFEARLRAKRIDPAVWMRTKITYEWDPDKSPGVVAAGVMTATELDSCKYKPSYRLQVTRVAGETNERTDGDV